MLDLPFDLQDLILGLLENTDIWALSQTSRSFRQLTTATLLAQYDISMSQVYSGSIRLTEKAAVIIPTIHRVQPITKLAMIPEPSHWEEWRLLRPLRGLPAILACISPTPEVEIHSDHVFYAGNECIGHLLEVLSQGGDPIVFIKSGNISVLSPYTRSHPRARFAAWWNRGECTRRIADDIENVCGSLNVKTVLSGTKSQFTLATFDFISGSSPVLNIGPLPLLSSPQLSALLAVLYIPHLPSVRIQADAGVHYRTLLQFIDRHKRLESFALEQGSIDARSLYPTANLSLSTDAPDSATRITMLTCAAEHIHYILPTQPGLMHLTLICPTDGLELSSALNHIAFLTTNPDMRQLTLDFTATQSMFPWLVSASFFPWRLRDNRALQLSLTEIRYLCIMAGSKRLDTLDLELLPSWIARRFPRLRSLVFRGGKWAVSAEQQSQIADSIAEQAGVENAEWKGLVGTGIALAKSGSFGLVCPQSNSFSACSVGFCVPQRCRSINIREKSV
ncbi:hypothetical protein R3P38DRAFT_3272204 [Favolaschia claudopus]|uniref:F-box domain-containing protein n=1 Tax=Favolaschia claudopus TaxID=2862362 RepID=A0AAW0B2U6_9AGAR